MEGTFDVALGYQLKIFEIERRNGIRGLKRNDGVIGNGNLMGAIVENDDLTEATFDAVMGYQLKMVIETE